MTTLLAVLGGLTREWRFDRMTTVPHPTTGDLTPMFAGFAKHGTDCGHEAVSHENHVDYVHDGRKHASHVAH